jgi:hypothetical protein
MVIRGMLGEYVIVTKDFPSQKANYTMIIGAKEDKAPLHSHR